MFDGCESCQLNKFRLSLNGSLGGLDELKVKLINESYMEGWLIRSS